MSPILYGYKNQNAEWGVEFIVLSQDEIKCAAEIVDNRLIIFFNTYKLRYVVYQYD